MLAGIHEMEMQKNQNDLDYFIFKWLWLIILMPKPVQLVIFITVIYLLVSRNGYKVGFDYVAVAMCMLAIVHTFAIMYNIAIFEPEVIRCIGAINTMMLWPIVALYVVYYKTASIDIFLIGKYCARNLYIMLIPALVTAFMYYGLHKESFVVLGKVLYETTYISEEPTTKFMGFNDFSNINLFYIMLNLMLALPYLNMKRKLLVFAMLLLSSFEVFLIHSRMGMVIFSVSVLFAFFNTIMIRYRKVLILLLMILAVLIVIVAYRELNEAFTSTIIYGNEESTLYRIDLLLTSVEKAWNYAPLWGMGIKEVFRPGESFVAYLGSHSTYIGFFYKTGILGLIIGLYILVRMNLKVIMCNGDNIVMRMMIMFIISFVILFGIEDVDGTNWSIFLYFTVLSILSNRKLAEGSVENETACSSNISTTVPSNGL